MAPNRHECGIDGLGRRAWAYCTVCNGRIHEDGCSSRKDKNRDCCKARHVMLYEAGHTKGICDDSQDMLSAWYTNEE